MTAHEIARLLGWRGRPQRRYRVQCPVHKSRGLTLAIYDDKERVWLHCFAGCESDDILATLGLTWKALLPDGGWNPKAVAEAKRKREKEDRERAVWMEAYRKANMKTELYEIEASYYLQELIQRQRFADEYHLSLQRARFWNDRRNVAWFNLLPQYEKYKPVRVEVMEGPTVSGMCMVSFCSPDWEEHCDRRIEEVRRKNANQPR